MTTRRGFLKVVAVGLATLGAGCSSRARRREEPLNPRFYLEAVPPQPGVSVVLPVSGARIRVMPQPVLTEHDVAEVALAETADGRGLRFVLRPAAADALQRLSAAHPGKRVVVLLRGEPVGVRVLNEPINDGQLVVFVERPDATLPELAARLQRQVSAAPSRANAS